MKKNGFELMAPVGSFASLRAVCEAGADAVYFGLGSFTMRACKRGLLPSSIFEIFATKD